MNMGLKLLVLYWVMIGCASTPKPVAKKKVGPAAAATKTAKGPKAVKAPAKPVATPPPPPAVEEEAPAEEEEEEDDQFSRMKKYYKK